MIQKMTYILIKSEISSKARFIANLIETYSNSSSSSKNLTGGVYIRINIVNLNKWYIGSTLNFEKREYTHELNTRRAMRRELFSE